MAKKPGDSAKRIQKAIEVYHDSLKEYRAVAVKHEGAVETAFQRLLDHVARLHHCQLIPKHKLKKGDVTIYPDGTVFEKELADLGMRLGFWEAKDIDDDLDKAIAAKIASKYPLNNTIFENTRRAVLFQGGKARAEFDLTDRKQVGDLLHEFFGYHEPEIENFHDAVKEFKDRVPDLAKGLVKILDESHKKNAKFQAAFDSFFTLCQQTLNPNISRWAVDEMLVQHLLTERLIRKIFDNPEFIKRNVIAAEIEKVIDALTSVTFSRDVFLRSLDRFYRAIEDAAHTLEDFSEKQHFLNTVYERFFQGYSVKVADTHGIVYTPQEIVDFMCASVEEVLKTEFNLTLGSRGVNILDPCTGTGNFIVNLINRIPKKDLPRVYKEQLFANEVMLLPYYIAALNIEHAYWERTGTYEAFEGLCFADTLDMTEDEYVSLFTEQNTARIRRQKKTPITVVIGNPPYNVRQVNENDNNKNRKYGLLDRRIRDTFALDSAASNKNALSDAYVKFFRWAMDRLDHQDGIVCFVSNNSFIDQIAYDGLRKHLHGSFGRLYILDLKGNIRKDSMRDGIPLGEKHTVFGLSAMVGISISVFVRNQKIRDHKIFYNGVSFRSTRDEKFEYLRSSRSVAGVTWHELNPDTSNNWLIPENSEQFSTFIPIGNKVEKGRKDNEVETVFKTYSMGLSSNRDSWVYAFDRASLREKVALLIETYNSEIDRWKRANRPSDIDAFVTNDDKKIKWSSRLKETFRRTLYAVFEESKIRESLYRPFCRQVLFFDSILNHRRAVFPQILPTSFAEGENLVIVLTDVGPEKPFMTVVSKWICDLHLVGSGCGSQCFPFYVYDEDGSNRRENITDWALEQFRAHYRGSPSPPATLPGGEAREITKWDIFYYVYGILHHPGYRTKFADNLKRELPRIPFAPPPTAGAHSSRHTPCAVTEKARGDVDVGARQVDGTRSVPTTLASGFWAFADAGKQLAALHLDYEKLEPWPLTWIETEGVPLSYHVEKMKLSKDKTSLKVNDSLTLAGIPPAAFEYRLGNRSALEWVIDQFQVSEDKRSGIRSDPNRADDPEYIVRLVGQVVRVSMETVRIVKGLPAAFA